MRQQVGKQIKLRRLPAPPPAAAPAAQRISAESEVAHEEIADITNTSTVKQDSTAWIAGPFESCAARRVFWGVRWKREALKERPRLGALTKADRDALKAAQVEVHLAFQTQIYA